MGLVLLLAIGVLWLILFIGLVDISCNLNKVVFRLGRIITLLENKDE